MTEYYRLQGKDFIPAYGMSRYRKRNLEGDALGNWDKYHAQIFERGSLLVVYNAAIFLGSFAGLVELLK